MILGCSFGDGGGGLEVVLGSSSGIWGNNIGMLFGSLWDDACLPVMAGDFIPYGLSENNQTKFISSVSPSGGLYTLLSLFKS